MKIIAIADSGEVMPPVHVVEPKLSFAPLKNFCINRRIKENFAMADALSPAREGACVLQK
jgi:hypothetical protein